jgi:hypothetical protein
VTPARRNATARALAALAAAAALAGAVGIPGGAPDRDVWIVVDASRSHGPDAGQLLARAAAVAAPRDSGARAGFVVYGADARLVADPAERSATAPPPAPPPLTAGFADGSRPELAFALVRARATPGRAAEILHFTDGRSDPAAFARAAAESAAAGFPVAAGGALAAPAEDVRLRPRGAAEPVGDGRVRVRAVVAGTHRSRRAVRVVAEPPAAGDAATLDVPAGGEAEFVATFALPDDAATATLRIADHGGDDARAANDALTVPVARRERRALWIDDGAFAGVDRAALRDALGAFRTERRKHLAAASAADFADADLVVLVDQDATAPAAAARLDALASAVVDGGTGVLIVGGPRAFRAGGYAATPLERIAPLSSRPDRGRDVRVLLDASGSMEQGGRYARALDAVRLLWESLGPDDVLRVRPFALAPRPPQPAEPGGAAAAGAALAALRDAAPAGGTRVLPAFEAELSTPPSAGRRSVYALIGDADDDALDRADSVAALRARLDAASVERFVLLLDPRPETEARAAALGGRVERVRDLAPRVLLDALEGGSFSAEPTETVDAGGDPAGAVPWRNRVRDAESARTLLRAADRAPLAATARRGLGTTAAVACPVDAPTLDALIAAAARPAALGGAFAERRGGDLAVFAPRARFGPPPVACALRIAGAGDVPCEEREPHVFTTPWRDLYAGARAAVVDAADGRAYAVASVLPADDPEYVFPPGSASGGAGNGPTPVGRSRRPALWLALFFGAAAVLLGRGRGVFGR